MNCSVCEKKLNDYLEVKLPAELAKEVNDHLKFCESCQDLYKVIRMLDQLILEEKEINPSPYLTNHVMNSIRPQNDRVKGESRIQRVIQPLLVAASIMLAILGGMKAGNIYSSAIDNIQVPIELALMDDLSLESVDLITQE